MVKVIGPFDAMEIFRSAECFSSAADVLSKNTWPSSGEPGFGLPFPEIMAHVRGDLMLPSVVIMAFTLELYFKCLKVIETKHHFQSHDLKLLFDDLSPGDRARIIVLTEEIRRSQPGISPAELAMPYDVPTVLDSSKDGFEDFRYIYSVGNPPPQFTASLIELAARKLVYFSTIKRT